MTEERNSKSEQNKSRRAGLNSGRAFLDELYLSFINEKDNELSRNISPVEFKSILRDFYSTVSEYVLDGKDVSIPCGMGTIVATKKQSDLRRVADYVASRIHGKIIYEDNSHTDGYRYSIKWLKGSPIFGIQNGYHFKVNRVTARKLASLLKSGYGYKFQSISKQNN